MVGICERVFLLAEVSVDKAAESKHICILYNQLLFE